MSKKIFMDQSDYSRMETGKKLPNDEIIERISNEFNIDKDTLHGIGPVTFEDGSFPNNSGVSVVGSYYSVPKEVVDIIALQQKTLESQQKLMEQILNVLSKK